MADAEKEFPGGTPEKDSRSAIGQRIKRAISDAGYSQLDASVAIETPISTLRNWIQGRSEPGATALGAISGLTGKSVDWIVRGQDHQPSQGLGGSIEGMLDESVVLKEAEFIIDAYGSFEDQLSPEKAAAALVERVRRRMRQLREIEAEDENEKDQLRA